MDSQHTNGHAEPVGSREINGSATTSRSRKSASSKYRHIAAVHSKVRSSCLSHDSENSPSFVGFRNLMVIVLGMLVSSGHFLRQADWYLPYSCHEFTTGSREFHEGILFPFCFAIGLIKGLTVFPVRSLNLHSVSRLWQLRPLAGHHPLCPRSLPSLRRVHHRASCRLPSQRSHWSRKTQ